MTHKVWYMEIDRWYVIPELNLNIDHMFYVLFFPLSLPENGALTMQVIYSVMGWVQNML